MIYIIIHSKNDVKRGRLILIHLSSLPAAHSMIVCHSTLNFTVKLLTGYCLHSRCAEHASVVWFKYFLFLS